MKVVVLTKFVPERTGRPPEIGTDFRLRRESGDGGLDMVDEPGLALARELAGESGSVTALSLGPERATAALQRALAVGADRGVLICDDALAGACALVTARVLAGALERMEFDLVLAGVESSDGATGTMPMTLAALLDIPSVTFARRLAVEGETIVIERLSHGGYDEVRCPMPALATITAGAAQARYPSAREMIAAKRRPLERLSLVDLGLRAASLTSTQWVTGIEFGADREPGELLEDPALAPARIVRFLDDAGVM